jgi:hypothetical protein
VKAPSNSAIIGPAHSIRHNLRRFAIHKASGERSQARVAKGAGKFEALAPIGAMEAVDQCLIRSGVEAAVYLFLDVRAFFKRDTSRQDCCDEAASQFLIVLDKTGRRQSSSIPSSNPAAKGPAISNAMNTGQAFILTDEKGLGMVERCAASCSSVINGSIAGSC